MNWNERADLAVNFLADTDEKVAKIRTKYEKDKKKAKRIWSAIYLRVTGTVDERKAQAEIHADYQTAVAAEMTALLEFEKLRNRRDTADTVVEFWRSWNKAKTDGQI